MTPASKKGRAIAKEIGTMIEVYLDDPSDSTLPCGGINGTAKRADTSSWIGILDRMIGNVPSVGLK